MNITLYTTEMVNGRLEIRGNKPSPSAEEFTYLHQMFWGKLEELRKATQKWSVQVPNYSIFGELSLDRRPQEVEFTECTYKTIDITKTDVFSRLPLDWQSSKTRNLLPCQPQKLLYLNDYKEMYKEMVSLDKETGWDDTTRQNACIGAQPGIGKLLQILGFSIAINITYEYHYLL